MCEHGIRLLRCAAVCNAQQSRGWVVPDVVRRAGHGPCRGMLTPYVISLMHVSAHAWCIASDISAYVIQLLMLLLIHGDGINPRILP